VHLSRRARYSVEYATNHNDILTSLTSLSHPRFNSTSYLYPTGRSLITLLTTRHAQAASLFLIPHPYNPLTSTLFSYKTTLNTVPLTYYDYHGAYGGNETHAGVSPTGSPRPRENATLVMLARNSEVNNVVRSVYELEDRFNRKYNYPWIFLNNEQFSDEFKSYASALLSPPTILPVSAYPDRVPATQVACRFSRQGLSTLGRSLKSIGISLRG
jgi:hypothetical protein